MLRETIKRGIGIILVLVMIGQSGLLRPLFASASEESQPLIDEQLIEQPYNWQTEELQKSDLNDQEIEVTKEALSIIGFEVVTEQTNEINSGEEDELPSFLRAFIPLEQNDEDILKVDESAREYEMYGYEQIEVGLYRYVYLVNEESTMLQEQGLASHLDDEDVIVGYRIYGELNGNEGWFICDANKNILAKIVELPIVWEVENDKWVSTFEKVEIDSENNTYLFDTKDNAYRYNGVARSPLIYQLKEQEELLEEINVEDPNQTKMEPITKTGKVGLVGAVATAIKGTGTDNFTESILLLKDDVARYTDIYLYMVIPKKGQAVTYNDEGTIRQSEGSAFDMELKEALQGVASLPSEATVTYTTDVNFTTNGLADTSTYVNATDITNWSEVTCVRIHLPNGATNEVELTAIYDYATKDQIGEQSAYTSIYFNYKEDGTWVKTFPEYNASTLNEYILEDMYISGNFWFDDNLANDKWDIEEELVPDIEVEALRQDGSSYTPKSTAITNSNGEYKVAVAGLGEHKIKVTNEQFHTLVTKGANDNQRESQFDPLTKTTDDVIVSSSVVDNTKSDINGGFMTVTNVKADYVVYEIIDDTPSEDDVTFTMVSSEDLNVGLAGAQFALYKWNGSDSDYTTGNHSEDIVDKDVLLDVKTGGGEGWQRIKLGGQAATALNDIFATDSSGLVNLGELASGYYTLIEVKAPSSYELPVGQWIMTIDTTKTDEESTSDWKIDFKAKSASLMPPAVIREMNGSTPRYKVVNTKPFGIGEAGLGGTRNTLILGVMLMLLALGGSYYNSKSNA